MVDQIPPTVQNSESVSLPKPNSSEVRNGPKASSLSYITTTDKSGGAASGQQSPSDPRLATVSSIDEKKSSLLYSKCLKAPIN